MIADLQNNLKKAGRPKTKQPSPKEKYIVVYNNTEYKFKSLNNIAINFNISIATVNRILKDNTGYPIQITKIQN